MSAWLWRIATPRARHQEDGRRGEDVPEGQRAGQAPCAGRRRAGGPSGGVGGARIAHLEAADHLVVVHAAELEADHLVAARP